MALTQISYADGSTRLAVLISLCGDAVRLAVKDSDDLVEFRLVGGTWVSEYGDPVTFEFPLAVFEAIGITPPSREAEPKLPANPRVGRNRVC